MVQPQWNVMESMEIAFARRDSPERNAMNVNQELLETSVTHVNQHSLIIHHARVCLSQQLVYCF